MLYEEIFMAGLGGQGMMFMGQLLAYSAIKEDKFALWTSSYGPEMRGGFAYCRTIISSEEIGSPVGIEPTTVIVMHPNFLDVAEQLKPGGFLFANSSLISANPPREDCVFIPIPAIELAGEVGSPQIANLVMLGAYVALVKPVSLETIMSVLPQVIPAHRAHLIPLNEKALRKGEEFAIKNFPQYA